MLTPSQKRQLKSLASVENTKYQIGKNEITPTLLDMLNKALTAREPIKIDVMKALSDHPVMEIALDLSVKLKAEVVQVVGRVIVLYRRNKENPKIKLVR